MNNLYEKYLEMNLPADIYMLQNISDEYTRSKGINPVIIENNNGVSLYGSYDKPYKILININLLLKKYQNETVKASNYKIVLVLMNQLINYYQSLDIVEEKDLLINYFIKQDNVYNYSEIDKIEYVAMLKRIMLLMKKENINISDTIIRHSIIIKEPYQIEEILKERPVLLLKKMAHNCSLSLQKGDSITTIPNEKIKEYDLSDYIKAIK